MYIPIPAQGLFLIIASAIFVLLTAPVFGRMLGGALNNLYGAPARVLVSVDTNNGIGRAVDTIAAQLHELRPDMIKVGIVDDEGRPCVDGHTYITGRKLPSNWDIVLVRPGLARSHGAVYAS